MAPVVLFLDELDALGAQVTEAGGKRENCATTTTVIWLDLSEGLAQLTEAILSTHRQRLSSTTDFQKHGAPEISKGPSAWVPEQC